MKINFEAVNEQLERVNDALSYADTDDTEEQLVAVQNAINELNKAARKLAKYKEKLSDPEHLDRAESARRNGAKGGRPKKQKQTCCDEYKSGHSTRCNELYEGLAALRIVKNCSS